MYSNEAQRANYAIYDDVKLKKNLGLLGLYKNISVLEPINRQIIQYEFSPT